MSTTTGKVIGGGAAAAIALCAPLVMYSEGLIPHTYADPVGVPTICYGHTGADVTPGRVATADECKTLLSTDLRQALDAVTQCVHVDMQPHEAAALTSFAYNVGPRALCTSTLARLANAGAPPAVWCAQLSRWVYATKLGVRIELPGLVKRRASERALCMGDAT